MLKHTLLRVWCYVAAVLILTGLVVIHEAGHWAAAEGFGARCRTFNIGFGPGVKLGDVGQTEIWFRSIPLGGSVEMPFGSTEKAKSIADLSTAQKVVVFGAGIAVNSLVALVLLGYCLTRKSKRPANDLRVEMAIQHARKKSAFKSRSLEILARLGDVFGILPEGPLFGFRGMVKTAGISSLALAILNVVPVPPLDGYRIYDALFVGGVLSAGRQSDTITATETIGIISGLAVLFVPLLLGFIPSIIKTVRFEIALYTAFKKLSRVKIEVVEA
jgi:membrane-associated protease RseP (regulator of RpoE activity)